MAGAIDGLHIPIIKPLDSVSNCMGFYSVILQWLVDFREEFFGDIYAGWLGKVHDA